MELWTHSHKIQIWERFEPTICDDIRYVYGALILGMEKNIINELYTRSIRYYIWELNALSFGRAHFYEPHPNPSPKGEDINTHHQRSFLFYFYKWLTKFYTRSSDT